VDFSPDIKYSGEKGSGRESAGSMVVGVGTISFSLRIGRSSHSNMAKRKQKNFRSLTTCPIGEQKTGILRIAYPVFFYFQKIVIARSVATRQSNSLKV